MQLRKFIVGAMCLISSCLANADEYIWTGWDDDYTTIYWVHEDSILNLDNGNTSFYVYSVNVDPKLAYDLLITEKEVRCNSREIRDIEYVTYLKGKKKDSGKLDKSWWRTRPHTYGDGWRKLICNKKEREAALRRSYGSEDELRDFSQKMLRQLQKEEAEKKGKSD